MSLCLHAFFSVLNRRMSSACVFAVHDLALCVARFCVTKRLEIRSQQFVTAGCVHLLIKQLQVSCVLFVVEPLPVSDQECVHAYSRFEVHWAVHSF